ncbi:RNA-guided endonuclease InsQ/TnpB family protein [Paucibacter soli]|uniref:RNA-guided endonuclease InsQ/TnpB family protein n=1 Tax=Paucibacter soli TaxID=3133433 RepID=UPI0030B4649C
MSTGYRFRAYPDDQVAGVLARWIGCQRFIKNAKVREDRYYRAFQRRFAAFAGQHAPVDQAYSHLIGDGGGCEDANTAWLREVPSHVLRNGAVRFYQAYQRFFKGLARRPTITSRHGEQSAWLTSELFEFVPAKHDADGVVTAWRLLIGTKKFPCGELPFKDHIAGHKPGWTPPASIHVSVNAGRWHVSFSNEAGHGVVTPTEQETLDHLRSFTAAELAAKTVGLDRGVAVPLMATVAAGAAPPRAFELLDIQKRRLAKKEQQRKRWQRRAARRVKGSRNRRKASQRAARAGLYAADVRTDFAHQTSRALVDGPSLLFVFEALQVKNMTRSAAGTVDAPGKKVAQKRGLNRSILASSWGETKLFTKYKALAAGKLCIEVPPHHSSQECSACGHTHADNRPAHICQSRFVCQRCGHAENADTNAARVIARRGVEAVVSGSYTLREKKKVGSLRRQPSTAVSEILGPERSEATPVETPVSPRAPRRPRLMSTKQEVPGASQETPTTALRA